MKLCLATLHQSAAFTPLALLYLKAYLVERRGFALDQIEILEFTLASQPDEIARQILATRPAVVGLSVYVWNVKTLMAACERIRHLRPDITIVVGGPEVGPIAKSVLDARPAVDVVVKSEGELPFAELTDAWRDGADLTTVKGICYRRAGGAVVENEDAPLLQDLNHLSSPHLAEYGSHRGRIVCIETQRGCVYRCSFCFYNKDLSVRNRRFDLGRVKEEILFWLRQEVRQIYLMDPIFNLYPERAKEICRFILEHNDRGIGIHAEVWAEFIDDELARLMRDAHFTFVEVGLQTTDQTALTTVDRRLKLQRFVQGIEHLKRHRLDFEVHLIYGLPGETRASFRKSLDFASTLDAPDLTVFPLMVLPGTELWRKAGALELKFDPEPPYFVRSHLSMNEADIDYGRRITDAVDCLRLSRTIRLLCRERTLSFSTVVDEWIAWRPTQPETDTSGEVIERFVLHVCAQHDIDDRFYRGFAALELRG